MSEIIMNVKILEEAGYTPAMLGLSLSYNVDESNMHNVSMKLADKDLGHNKFLEFIEVWLDVSAPLYWWIEADTYRLSSKQSESTMHTLINNIKKLTPEQFCKKFEPGTMNEYKVNEIYNELDGLSSETEKLIKAKQLLPSSFIQRRIWKMSYKTLRNIILQRKNHRLPHWKKFVTDVLSQVKHPEYFEERKNNVS